MSPLDIGINCIDKFYKIEVGSGVLRKDVCLSEESETTPRIQPLHASCHHASYQTMMGWVKEMA